MMNKIVFALYTFGGNVHIVIKSKNINAKYNFYLFSFGIFHEIHPLYKYWSFSFQSQWSWHSLWTPYCIADYWTKFSGYYQGQNISFFYS